MSFLISGFGRSGTTFLSSVMNRSKTFTVYHEPRQLRDLNENFSYKDIFVGNYGEVNGAMRKAICHIDWIDRGIILRNPYEIFLSGMNRNPVSRYDSLCRDIVACYLVFDKYISDMGMRFINFHKMTTDIQYLYDIMNAFQITDVELDKGTLARKINQNKRITHFEVSDKFKEKLSVLDCLIKKYELFSV